VEDRPELGPPGDRSHFSEEAVFQQRQDGGVEAKKQPPGTVRRRVMAIPCLSVAVTMG